MSEREDAIDVVPVTQVYQSREMRKRDDEKSHGSLERVSVSWTKLTGGVNEW